MFLVATSGCPQGGKSTRWCHHPLPPRRYMRARRIRTSQYLMMLLDATLPADVATPVAARQYLVMFFDVAMGSGPPTTPHVTDARGDRGPVHARRGQERLTPHRLSTFRRLGHAQALARRQRASQARPRSLD